MKDRRGSITTDNNPTGINQYTGGSVTTKPSGGGTKANHYDRIATGAKSASAAAKVASVKADKTNSQKDHKAAITAHEKARSAHERADQTAKTEKLVDHHVDKQIEHSSSIDHHRAALGMGPE